jgi:hypothetical protein
MRSRRLISVACVLVPAPSLEPVAGRFGPGTHRGKASRLQPADLMAGDAGDATQVVAFGKQGIRA